MSLRFPEYQLNRPVRILGIGYLLPVKRWELLLLAIEQLKERGHSCLAANCRRRPIAIRLGTTCSKISGLSTVFRFMGHVDDIPKLIRGAAFVVHTADAEGCPNAVMEAMACGRAVVARMQEIFLR